MLVDDLLFSITVQDYGEGIEGRNGSLHLVAIHQKHGDGLPLPAELVSKISCKLFFSLIAIVLSKMDVKKSG